MTPTDNLVARLLTHRKQILSRPLSSDLAEAAAQLAAVTAENARLREALTMARDEYGFDMNDEQLSLIEAALSQKAPK